MSGNFGDSFSGTYLETQNQQLKQALAVADQIMQQRRQEWAESPDNPNNQDANNPPPGSIREQYLKAQIAHMTAQTDAEGRFNDPNSPQNLDRAEQRRQSGELHDGQMQNARGANFRNNLGAGMPYGAAGATAGLRPEEYKPIQQAGVMAGNQQAYQDAVAQPGVALPPDAGSPTVALQGGAPVPPGQMGPSIPLGVGMSIEPGMAGMRLAEPPGGSAMPFTPEQFDASQGPGYVDKLAIAREKQKNDALKAGATQLNAETREKQQSLNAKIATLKTPLWKAQADIIGAKIAQMPDELEDKQALHEGMIDHLKWAEQHGDYMARLRTRSVDAVEKGQQTREVQNQIRFQSSLASKVTQYKTEADTAAKAMAHTGQAMNKITAVTGWENDPIAAGQYFALQAQREADKQKRDTFQNAANVTEDMARRVQVDLERSQAVNRSDGKKTSAPKTRSGAAPTVNDAARALGIP